MEVRVEDVARVCHEANRAWCCILGDDSHLPWELAPDWLRQSVVEGVRFHLENPEAGPAQSHESWLRHKLATGWVYGEAKDPRAKTHPLMVPYDELPPEQKLKDRLFLGIVHLLMGAPEKEETR